MRFVRASVLLVIGFAIAFSATLHEQAAFDRWLVVAALVVLGAVWACEAAASRQNPALARTAVLQSGTAIAAALVLAVLPFADQTLAMSLVVTAWAILVALLQLTTVLRGTQTRAAGLPAVLLSALLAVVVLLSRDDAVAVIGFFGGYAVVCGVFLGISAFDSRGAAADGAPADALTQGPTA
ncbi:MULTISPECIES: hypothetical protein [Leucobacter]|uniref:DUF308 domain-containing protein n=1 Tax=Leucobacter iarius TaxID=333963 RepID=A0ABP4XK19_9MICO|nr:hypothetical protein [Leucobacter sp. Ag1]